ncbi:MAG TPA: radical SAM protein [Chitinivibrionales bacterium]|nr:radical SAM protein [Chitinivibrionales bacterium]
MNHPKQVHKNVPSPILVSFGITRQCDLKCPHCYSDSKDKDPQELTFDEAARVIDDIAGLGARIVILDGGEPTLRPDFVDLIKYAAKQGLRTVAGSHGMGITAEFAARLKQAGCRGVAISLDGADARTHDSWRGVEGAWSKTIEGAKNCAAAGLAFQFAPLLHAGNCRQLGDIIALAKQNKSDAVEIFDYVPTGRGKGKTDHELDTEQRRQLIETVIERQRQNDMIYRVIALPQYWVMVEKTVPEDEILLKFVRSCCAAGTRYITILPNGDVIPCMVLQVKLGNVREKSLKDIWNHSPLLATLRNRDLLKGKCGKCSYKLTCAGARCKAYEKTGDMMAEDPTCWFTEEETRAKG